MLKETTEFLSALGGFLLVVVILVITAAVIVAIFRPPRRAREIAGQIRDGLSAIRRLKLGGFEAELARGRADPEENGNVQQKDQTRTIGHGRRGETASQTAHAAFQGGLGGQDSRTCKGCNFAPLFVCRHPFKCSCHVLAGLILWASGYVRLLRGDSPPSRSGRGTFKLDLEDSSHGFWH